MLRGMGNRLVLFSAFLLFAWTINISFSLGRIKGLIVNNDDDDDDNNNNNKVWPPCKNAATIWEGSMMQRSERASMLHFLPGYYLLSWDRVVNRRCKYQTDQYLNEMACGCWRNNHSGLRLLLASYALYRSWQLLVAYVGGTELIKSFHTTDCRDNTN